MFLRRISEDSLKKVIQSERRQNNCFFARKKNPFLVPNQKNYFRHDSGINLSLALNIRPAATVDVSSIPLN